MILFLKKERKENLPMIDWEKNFHRYLPSTVVESATQSLYWLAGYSKF